MYNRLGKTSLRGPPLALTRLKDTLKQEKSRVQWGEITIQEVADVVKRPNTDDIEYLAYNTTDNEKNNASDSSSIPASATDRDNSDHVDTNNKGIENEEDHA
ncbi:hypothetical protein EV426DRAFT_709148 [Tirmania nivea]|nr:hypothetical protein EV426DRAFT_709148 [Tirmania nivea]